MSDKGKIGGKHQRIGYYGNNDAGVRQEGKSNTAGQKHEFEGSQSQEYTFYSPSKGTITITARSFDEAWRKAKILGYSRRNYRGK